MGKIAQFKQKNLKWIEFKFQRDDVALEFRIPEPSYIEVQKIIGKLEKKYHVTNILQKLQKSKSVDELSQGELDIFKAYDADLLAEIVEIFESCFPGDSTGKLQLEDLTKDEIMEVFEAARGFFRRLTGTEEPANSVGASDVQTVRETTDRQTSI
jgi:hypothetical protein